MSHVWQHPYVNVFKHCDVQGWKKATKCGEVTTAMDKAMKCTVFKITGSIPAGNYIQLPRTSSQSLGLTGRYFYLLFRPIPGKYFVAHLDVATSDGLIIRISFSNLFKEFKATSTWLQFPFLCRAAKGSVSDYASTGEKKDYAGPAPVHTRFCVLCLDFEQILRTYVSRRYSYLKTIKLCSNMLVKNIFTSDLCFEPGCSLEQARQLKELGSGRTAMPREMAYPLQKSENWHDVYDIIRFPIEGHSNPLNHIKYGEDEEIDPVTAAIHGKLMNSPRSMQPRVVDVTRATSGRPAARMAAATQPNRAKGPLRKPVAQLPRVGVDESGKVASNDLCESEVHVYATTSPRVNVDQDETIQRRLKKRDISSMEKVDRLHMSLQPDPILQLRRIVGFGGASTRDVLWSSDGSVIVYPCHAVVVAMQVSNGHQRFFIGHTDKVSSLSMNGQCTLLASGQTGPQSVVKVWNFQSGECLAMFKTHVHSLHCLSMSHNGTSLCGVGRDNHGKNMVVIWNLSKVHKHGQISVMAKAHTEVDIVRMRISAFDDTRMVSCGRDNVRLWRVKDGNLRSAPVNLGDYHNMEFTDCSFDGHYEPGKDPLDRTVYACSKSGLILEIDYRKVAILHVRKLLAADAKKGRGSGIAINSLCVNETFCATGSDDGYLRLWPLDFKQVFLEAEHEGPVTATQISADGFKVLCGTSTGNVGILDVHSRGYTTVMRSHTARVVSMTLDPTRRQLATVSEDHSIRIWQIDTMQQLYDFSAPKDVPCAIAFHPTLQVFACGFESGAVRVFDVAQTAMLAEHRQHRGIVTGLIFSHNGRFLYSSGSAGTLTLYDAENNKFLLLRVLATTTALGDQFGPDALALSPDGRALAFVGPSELTVSVVNATTLDELLRIDISVCGDMEGPRASEIDSAVRVKYAPTATRHLLVTTAQNKLIKLDARNGKIISEMANIHRSGCTTLDVSSDGRHLATAGDRVIKIWDYHMRLDINFQVFIGHAESIGRLCFTPDQKTFISTGECIFIWDFLAYYAKKDPPLEGRTKAKSYYSGEEEIFEPYAAPSSLREQDDKLNQDTPHPRTHVPQPMVFEPGETVADISLIHKQFDEEDLQGEDIISQASEQVENLRVRDFVQQAQQHNGSFNQTNTSYGEQPRPNAPQPLEVTPRKNPKPTTDKSPNHPRPKTFKHFKPREVKHQLAQRRYTAPPNQAGLKLESIIGYNGNGRGNMVWQPDTGMFVYSNGSTVIVEELDGGKQQHLNGHNEEVSTIALQNDGQVLASASASRTGLKNALCQILLWDLREMQCSGSLSYHRNNIACLQFSRDDRFLISVGDYKDCSLAIWNMAKLELLVSSHTSMPVHDVRWDPYACNEFSTVGCEGTLLFWLLDETSATMSGGSVGLNVHEATLPPKVANKRTSKGGLVDLTCQEYGDDSTLYVGSSTGQISAWDTRDNTCFMHWEADNTEIVVIVSKAGRMVTGSQGHTLRLWSGVTDLKEATQTKAGAAAGITMEDEMTLDGGITCAAFDDTMDMGIAGTEAGTLWYVNWTERTSIRLVSGHATKIECVSCHGGDYLATGSSDGSLRVWALSDREQMLQFQVLKQACKCVAFDPHSPPSSSRKKSGGDDLIPLVAAGYGDGTVRVFDLNKVEMALKMQPHAAAVTAISFSSDGDMILSGGEDGLVAVSSPSTGMTVRVINDHRGAAISCIDVTQLQGDFVSSGRRVSAPALWLAASSDRRVSVWSADWSKDFCQLIDWLTFPAPPPSAVSELPSCPPPTLAQFSHEEPDIVVYTGYGMLKQIQFYSLSEKKVLRSSSLTHWATALDICSKAPLIAIGSTGRLVKLVDYFEGSFQDFTGHDDAVHLVAFTADGKRLVTVAHNELMLWSVAV